MRKLLWTTLAVAALSLAACGKSESAGGGDAGGGGADAGGDTGLASAEKVAKDSRGKIKCPPKITTPARAAGLPVDDVVGIRAGMTYDEAANLVLCDNDMIVVEEETYRGFDINSYGQKYRKGFNAKFAEREKSSQEILQEMQDEAMRRGSNSIEQDMAPGQTRYYVSTVGLPGEERVLSVSREEWYEDGKNPPLESVAQALIAKYGQPSETLDGGNGQRDIRWAYDPMNRLITETSPLFRQCYLRPHPNAGANLSPDCGTVVAATIMPVRDNPTLAQSLQAATVQQADGYALLMGTEEAFLAADNARKAKELQDATKNSTAPKL